MINDKYKSDFAEALPRRRLSFSDDLEDFVIRLKSKLDALAGKHPAVLQNLSPKVRQRVEILRGYQRQHNDLEAEFFKEKAALEDKHSKRQHNDLEAEFFKEKAALEDKYQKKYEHLYSKRCDVVTGVVEVEGVKSEAAADNKEDKATQGVPLFWCRAMKINKILCEEISMRDEKALIFLEDIKWHRIDDHKGFKLEFFFGLNPFFKNSVLTKTYHMIDDDELILEKAIGTEIEWLPGKSLTQKVLKEKPKKGSENAKPITETESCESVFNFVNPPQVPEEEDDIDEDDITETESGESFFNFFYPPQVPEEDDIETAEMFENQMKHDYDIGLTIRNEIIPHAVSWFTGEACQGDESEDDDMEDGDYEDDEGW